MRAGLEARHRLVLVDIDAQPHRQALADRADDEAGGALRGHRLDAFDRGVELPSAARAASRGAAARSACHQIRPQPRAAARLNRTSARPQRVPAQRDAGERRGRGEQQEGRPLRQPGR